MDIGVYQRADDVRKQESVVSDTNAIHLNMHSGQHYPTHYAAANQEYVASGPVNVPAPGPEPVYGAPTTFYQGPITDPNAAAQRNCINRLTCGHVIKAGCLFLIVQTMAVTIVGLATTGWFSYSLFLGEFGLWKTCVGLRDGCVDIDNSLGWLNATRAMIILGLLCQVAAGIDNVMALFFSKYARKMMILTAIFCFTSAGFLVVGVIIFAAKTKDIQGSLSYSFGITIGGSVLAILSASVALVSAHESRSQSR